MLRTLMAALFLLGLLAPAGQAFEEYHAVFEGAGTTGATGTGTATFLVDDQHTQITYWLGYEGLTGPELAAHIHHPDGSTLYAFAPGNPKVGVWQDPGLFNVLLMQNEQLYILIHTDEHPGGELRGNILAGPLTTKPDSWGAIKALYERD